MKIRIPARRTARLTEAEETVRPILEGVRKRGDKGLMEYARQFDKLERKSVCVPVQELADACHGDHRPDCPILRDLEKNDGAQATTGNVTPIMSPSRTKAASRVSDQPSVPAGRMGRTIQR